MKKTLNLLLFSVVCLSIMAFTPHEDRSKYLFDDMIKIYEDKSVSFSIESSATSAIVQSKFDPRLNNLQISTESVINFIQVTDSENRLQYQLPVETKKLNLNLSDFEVGNYRLAFKLDQIPDLIFANLKRRA